MKLRTLAAAFASFVAAAAMPFNTLLIDFTAWTPNEVMLVKAALIGLGLYAIGRGI